MCDGQFGPDVHTGRWKQGKPYALHGESIKITVLY